MYLKKAIFKNVAPFGDLNLSFEQHQVIVFSGINGRGKTTILSYIADAFFEIAKNANFEDILKDNSKYYRVISQSGILKPAKYSLVYLRFVHEDQNIDYVEKVGEMDSAEFDAVVHLDNKVDFQKLNTELSNKFVQVKKDTAKNIFQNNVLTYFPSDRLEVPAWMNDIEYKEGRYSSKVRYTNRLHKNIEARTIAEQIAGWILDVAYDYTVSVNNTGNKISFSDTYSHGIIESLNLILKRILSGKIDSCRFGVGQRNSGQSRISIVKDTVSGLVEVSPSIYHLSSGEISSLLVFAEIIKQYDTNSFQKDFKIDKISGIVAIDEIDKHLHIKLQKEILPSLIEMFPNLQFIISSHSPFFALGAQATLKDRIRFLDLSIGGNDIAVMKTEELEELYLELTVDNQYYRKLYEELGSETASSKRLRILTEGNNVKYIEKAIDLFAPEIKSQIYICTGVESLSGKNQLLQTYSILSKTNAFEKTIFVWDCDVLNNTKSLTETEKVYKFTFEKNEANTKVKTGIENLFPESLFTKVYYPEKETVDEYGAKKTCESFNKNAFCESTLLINDKETFRLFEPLIEKIKTIIKTTDSKNPVVREQSAVQPAL